MNTIFVQGLNWKDGKWAIALNRKVKKTDTGKHSISHTLSCGHIFFKNGLGIMLADFNKPQSLPKDAVNPKWRENQKNRCTMAQNSIAKPETQWFCVH
ncbi:hypothetical protein IM793_05940 [Pedobacter sp. MR2016-19]|uniref:hypothetical protein n=1 Tax=Pedobacter sp. MR2016-19 TaxID=2780089 RepID=UPI001873E546|nr:hypothetical protein [Pedobacter sp. MR2016-19]MBE5318686.1 hypothetical protein [Pedobacter sp. MR2016-19]